MADFFEDLAAVQHISVKEQASAIEALTAALGNEFEMPNKYSISFDDDDEQVFFAAEQTDCCRRQQKQCCPDCAGWELSFLYTKGGNSIPAFEMKRDCTFTCCCFNRPKAALTYHESEEVIGYLKDPFACCGLTFDVLDENEEVVMHANGGCCQWGLCCPMPCGPCARVHFDLEDPSGGSIGSIDKELPCKCCGLGWLFASDVDNYEIDVSEIDDKKLKALAMALAVFIDFRYFSDNNSDDHSS
jgi:hypothetical protein